MKFPIGFNSVFAGHTDPVLAQPIQHIAPRKSLVKVHFEEDNNTLTYYNDLFDLREGDWVFVEGHYEGVRGQVLDLTYNFKIKSGDYKKVFSQADTQVSGRFYSAGSHLLTFDPHCLPFSKVRTWFLPPDNETEYLTGSDESSFSLADLSGMNVSPKIAERGHNYFLENRVLYLSTYEGCGQAIVEGNSPYLVEFQYQGGQISNMVCDCPCACTCKHEVAVMLQLKVLLETIEKHYPQHISCGYFAAVGKSAFCDFVLSGNQHGTLAVNV